MRVDIDYPGCQHEAACVDGLARLAQVMADGGNAAVLHGEVGAAQRIAQTIGDIGIPDNQIEHCCIPYSFNG